VSAARGLAGRVLVGRADATPADGAGHVARTLSVLAAWRALGGAALLMSRDLARFWGERASAGGVEVVAAGPDADLPDAVAREFGADAVLLDGYRFTDALVERCADRVVTARIDDFVARPPRCDVFVDPNLVEVPRTHVPRGTRVLGGPAHALLRPEFREPPARTADAVGRVLVSFGSSDPARLTVPVARALAGERGGGPGVDVVAGPAMDASDRAALLALAAATPGGALRVLEDVRDMPAALAAVEVGLIAGGTTVFELLACGVVPVCVQVVENQRRSSGGVAERELGLDLGWHADLDAASIARATLELAGDAERVAGLSARGRAAVDGRGAERVARAVAEALEHGARRAPHRP